MCRCGFLPTAVIKNKFYLLDVSRERLDYPGLKREVHRLRERYRPSKILVEDKASGTQLIQELKTEGVYKITPYTPSPLRRVERKMSQNDLADALGLLLQSKRDR
jgi:phage terminase large subunit-like protein